MARVTIEVDLPPGVEITAYERHQEGHGFEVRWPLPELLSVTVSEGTTLSASWGPPVISEFR